MSLITQKHPSESGHWYTQAGEPAYTVIGKNGKARNTTLADARKMSLVPSVTTILKVADKPALNRWRENQMLMAALTLPRIDGESLDDFKRRAWEDAQEHGRQARETGTAIHAALESAYSGAPYDSKYALHVDCTRTAINEYFGERYWSAEQSFSHPLGFGGKCDLHCGDWVVDFKTKEFGPDDTLKAYDEHAMQLAAYAHGLRYPEADLAIIYVSVSHPGLVQVVEVDQSRRGWEMFCALLDYWQTSKRYFPRVD